MAFDDILERIRQDGTDAVAAVRDAAAAAIRKTEAAAAHEADMLREQLMERAHRRADEQAERMITLAQLDHRKAALAEKQRALQTAFDTADARLADLPADQAKTLWKRVILERAETGNEEIVAGTGLAALFDAGFVAELNAALDTRGHLRAATAPGDFAHGVVLREGRKEINLRLSVLLAEARERLSYTVAQHLFPESA